MRKLAVFDLDGTLLAGDSFRRFMIWFFFHHSVKLAYLVLLLSTITLRKLRLISHKVFKERLLSPLVGLHSTEILNLGNLFFKHVGYRMLRGEGINTVNQVREEGYCLVLATASPDIYPHAFAKHCGIDIVYAVALEFDGDSKFTGHLVDAEGFGSHKLSNIRTNPNTHGAILHYAFSNDFSDIPILNAAKVPIAVNPDSLLKEYCSQNKWKVVYWR